MATGQTVALSPKGAAGQCAWGRRLWTHRISSREPFAGKRRHQTLPRIESQNPLLLVDAEQGMEHAPVLDLSEASINALTLHLEACFGEVHRKGPYKWRKAPVRLQSLQGDGEQCPRTQTNTLKNTTTSQVSGTHRAQISLLR